jgi:hypothetical protein
MENELQLTVLELLTDCQSIGLRTDVDLKNERVVALFARALTSADVTVSDLKQGADKVLESTFFPKPFDLIAACAEHRDRRLQIEVNEAERLRKLRARGVEE